MSRPAERNIAGMTCSDVLAVLSDFVDGELDPRTREHVLEHLRGCNWCEQFGGRFSAVVETLRRELREPEPLAENLRNRLLAKIDWTAEPKERSDEV